MFHDVHRLGDDVTIHMLPQFPRLEREADVSAMIRDLRTKVHGMPANVTWIIAPSNKSMKGFQTIEQPTFGAAVYAEGTILKTPGTAAIIQTADCPVVIARNRLTRALLPFHAGRNALDGSQGPCPDCGSNIASMALQQFVGEQSGDLFEVHVGAHICGGCFDHSHDDAEPHVAWFRTQYGEKVFADWDDGCLDLRAVLAAHFEHVGIPAEHISWDGRCTFEDKALSSYRRNDVHRNTFVVIRT